MKRWIGTILLLFAVLVAVEGLRDGGENSGTYATPASSKPCCTYYYGFNTTVPPVDNVHVRRALSYAVDRKTLVEAVLKGGQRPAETFACPGIFGTPEDAPDAPGIPIFNPEKARDELELAGYPGGEGLPKITLMFNTSEGHQKIAQTIRANWKDHLGIEVELADQEWTTYLATLSDDAPQVWRLGWCAANPGQSQWVVEQFHSTKGNHPVMWSNSEYDRIVDQLDTETDPAKQLELFRQAQQLLTVDQAVIIPLFHYSQTPDLGPVMSPPPPAPTAHAQVRFEDVIPDGPDEVVILKNFGDAEADLTGWEVQSVDRTTGEVLDTFRFPDGFTLPPGGVVRIHSGPAAQSNPPEDILWKNTRVWNDDDGKAVLNDQDGRMRAARAWYTD